MTRSRFDVIHQSAFWVASYHYWFSAMAGSFVCLILKFTFGWFSSLTHKTSPAAFP
jgi:hypothetical protein